MQFIVTSHSPFVAQAASDGGLIVLQPSGPDGAVEAHRPVESVKGWRADQILTSPLFGSMPEHVMRRRNRLSDSMPSLLRSEHGHNCPSPKRRIRGSRLSLPIG